MWRSDVGTTIPLIPGSEGAGVISTILIIRLRKASRAMGVTCQQPHQRLQEWLTMLKSSHKNSWYESVGGA